MIYITTALYCEAKPIIEYYNLKKDIDSKVFQIFNSDKVMLIVTGVNKINAAIAVAHLVSAKKLKEEDIIVNIGVSGAKEQKYNIGDICIVNKITDNETKKCYYPDILYRHNFNELSIETFSVIVRDKKYLHQSLCDMESSGFYAASSKYFQSHKILLFKVISDKLEEIPNKEFVWELISKHIKEIDSYLIKIQEDLLNTKEKNIDLSKVDKITENLNLTISQRNILSDKYRKYLLREKSEPKLDRFYWKKVNNKDERNKIYRQIINLLS